MAKGIYTELKQVLSVLQPWTTFKFVLTDVETERPLDEETIEVLFILFNLYIESLERQTVLAGGKRNEYDVSKSNYSKSEIIVDGYTGEDRLEFAKALIKRLEKVISAEAIVDLGIEAYGVGPEDEGYSDLVNAANSMRPYLFGAHKALMDFDEAVNNGAYFHKDSSLKGK